LPIPPAQHDTAAIAAELLGEILGIADAEDLGGGWPRTPTREKRLRPASFRMTPRQVDDQPPDLSLPHGGELSRDHLDVPVRRERGLRVELPMSPRDRDIRKEAGSVWRGPDAGPSCCYYEGYFDEQARVSPCASVTAATGRRKDAARRLSPVSFGDPCPGPAAPVVIGGRSGRSNGASVEPSNWDWRSRAAGG